MLCKKKSGHVICHYNRGTEKAQETLSLIEKEGGRGELIQFDVTDRDECKIRLDELLENHGSHILCRQKGWDPR